MKNIDTLCNGGDYPYYNLRTGVYMFVCHTTPPTVVGQLHPDLRHRISMITINASGCFLGGRAQILYVNVCRVALLRGGGGYYKSPPFTGQYSCPHVLN